jgi:sulfate adenylyltransferase subunit 1
VGAGMIVDVAARENERKELTQRKYTDAEKALNLYIRENFPEWECKSI